MPSRLRPSRQRPHRAWHIALLMAAAAATLAEAQSLSQTLTATAQVTAIAKLTISAAALVFPDADPDTVAEIPAAGGALTIRIKTRAPIGSPISLTVRATDDLRSGLDTIPATQLRWTATGAGFGAGTVSQTADQTVAAFTNSGDWTGSQFYALLNSWTYPTGTYTTTLTYTLTVP